MCAVICGDEFKLRTQHLHRYHAALSQHEKKKKTNLRIRFFSIWDIYLYSTKTTISYRELGVLIAFFIPLVRFLIWTGLSRYLFFPTLRGGGLLLQGGNPCGTYALACSVCGEVILRKNLNPERRAGSHYWRELSSIQHIYRQFVEKEP